jgi:hypothetical protein
MKHSTLTIQCPVVGGEVDPVGDPQERGDFPFLLGGESGVVVLEQQ